MALFECIGGNAEWEDISSSVQLYQGITARNILAYRYKISNNVYYLNLKADVEISNPSSADILHIDGYKTCFRDDSQSNFGVERPYLWLRDSSNNDVWGSGYLSNVNSNNQKAVNFAVNNINNYKRAYVSIETFITT